MGAAGANSSEAPAAPLAKPVPDRSNAMLGNMAAHPVMRLARSRSRRTVAIWYARYDCGAQAEGMRPSPEGLAQAAAWLLGGSSTGRSEQQSIAGSQRL